MAKPRAKPQGKSGPLRMGSQGAGWQVIPFPDEKTEREKLVANLFVKAFDNWVATESEPTLAPFGQPMQNEESDLDFTVETSLGQMLMELVEFAPLDVYGPRFQDAPKSLRPSEKAKQGVNLIRMKSTHQGGEGRFLAVYNTEQGFWLDPPSIELMRRAFVEQAPRFERVYYVSIHDLESASVSEIYPGKPHHIFGNVIFDDRSISLPHPTEFTEVRIVTWQSKVLMGSQFCQVNFTLNYVNFGSVSEIIGGPSN